MATSQFLGLARLIHEPGLYGTFALTLGKSSFDPQRNVVHPGLDLVPATSRMADLEISALSSSTPSSARAQNIAAGRATPGSTQ